MNSSVADKRKILLVEDEEEMLELFSLRLERNGYDIIKAKDGQEALEKACKENPDLILLDIMIPKINGLEVCHMLKVNDKYKHIPVIILSALMQERDKEKAREYGAVAYFVKPFNLSFLLRKIASLLG